MLPKYVADPSHILDSQLVTLREDLTYKEEPVHILDRKEQILRNKKIAIVKVLWRDHNVEETTWQPEELMREQYSHLFN